MTEPWTYFHCRECADALRTAAGVTMTDDRLMAALDEMTPVRRRVLQLRYGLYDGVSADREVIAERWGVDVERILRYEREALAQLRR